MKNRLPCVTSGCCSKVDMTCALQGYYAAYSSNSLPTFEPGALRKRWWGITAIRCVISLKIADLNSFHQVHKITVNSSRTSQALQSVLPLTKVRVNFLSGSLRSKLSNNVKFCPRSLSLNSVLHYILVQTSPKERSTVRSGWFLWEPWRHMEVQLHAFLTSVLIVSFMPRLFYSRTKMALHPLKSRLGGSQTVWTLPGIEPPFFGHPALSLIITSAAVSRLCVKCITIKWITYAQRRMLFISSSCVYLTRFIFLFSVCTQVRVSGSTRDVFDSYYNLLKNPN
jgi:hypothetical protein